VEVTVEQTIVVLLEVLVEVEAPILGLLLVQVTRLRLIPHKVMLVELVVVQTQKTLVVVAELLPLEVLLTLADLVEVEQEHQIQLQEVTYHMLVAELVPYLIVVLIVVFLEELVEVETVTKLLLEMLEEQTLAVAEVVDLLHQVTIFLVVVVAAQVKL
jgi:hypothetical protein